VDGFEHLDNPSGRATVEVVDVQHDAIDPVIVVLGVEVLVGPEPTVVLGDHVGHVGEVLADEGQDTEVLAVVAALQAILDQAAEKLGRRQPLFGRLPVQLRTRLLLGDESGLELDPGAQLFGLKVGQPVAVAALLLVDGTPQGLPGPVQLGAPIGDPLPDPPEPSRSAADDDGKPRKSAGNSGGTGTKDEGQAHQD